MMLHARVFDTPVGELVAVVRDDGRLVALPFLDDHDPATLARRYAGASSVRFDDSPATEPIVAQVAEYFDGGRRRFEMAVAPEGTAFQQTVWSALALIPYGATLGYAELARRIGRPGAARAVGRANATNPIPIVLPCHRVIGASGDLTGYGGGIHRKRFLLHMEGSLSEPLALTADQRATGTSSTMPSGARVR
jgi:methylated-DNA-[protein]-cysteine S-methyltransferase